MGAMNIGAEVREARKDAAPIVDIINMLFRCATFLYFFVVANGFFRVVRFQCNFDIQNFNKTRKRCLRGPRQKRTMLKPRYRIEQSKAHKKGLCSNSTNDHARCGATSSGASADEGIV